MASRHLLSLLLCVVALGWLAATATTATAASKEKITLEFNDVDIKVVVKFISQLVHKNFIVDDGVKGKVTVISPVPVSADEAYEIFLSILDVKGFAAVPSGRVVKIIPAAEARAKRLPMVTAGGVGGPTDDRIRTQLIQLEHIDASRVVPLLKPLIAKTSHVEAFAAANTILLTDVASNIDRILKIIRVIDTPGFQQQLAIIALRYATADKLAGQISSIFGGSRAKATPRPVRRGTNRRAAKTGLAETEVKVFADERTNSLIVFATKNDLKKVKQLVERLDIAPPEDNSRVRIYRLQHAVAEDLAGVLTGVVSAQAKAGGAAGRAPAPRVAAAARARQGRGVLGEGASIVSDTATNSLIVTASPEEHSAIEALIKELDVQPLQVFVEALIVEVGMNSDLNLGIEWRALAKKGSSGVLLGNATNAGALDTLSGAGAGTPLSLPKGLAVGFLGDTITFNGVTIPSLGVLVTALKTDGNSNIISTPQILTLDNKEAEFDAVTTLPFQTGTSTGTGVNVVSTFDFRDVGTKLRITPHINNEGYVRMEIHQEVANVDENASAPGLPVTSKRSADTVAVVKDGHTIVIGGLISNNMGTSHNKVPLLGDIPFLGALFRSTSHSTKKTNLLVFITPHVIRRAEELRPFTEKRSRENNLLQGKAFKGMMRETFPQGFPGIDDQGIGMEGEAVVPPVATPAAVPRAVVSPPATTPAVTPPVTAAPADLTERLRNLLSVPAAEGGTTAPSPPAAPTQPTAPAAVAPSLPPAEKSAEPTAEGDDLMQRLHQILEEPTAASAAPKAAPKPPPSAAEELHLKEVEQPLFEPPKKRGWFGRTLDRIRGKGEAAETPETTPDAVSPIYRYTPETPPPPATGDATGGQ